MVSDGQALSPTKGTATGSSNILVVGWPINMGMRCGPGDARLILDTNAPSAAAGENPGVMKVLGPRTGDSRSSDREYRYGIAQSRHRARYRRWLDSLIVDCTVLDISEQTTDHYAAITVMLRAAGKPIPTSDLWIAALCREHASLLSRDRRFDVVPGIQCVRW
jgi:predicted nucleic acid-binding protein